MAAINHFHTFALEDESQSDVFRKFDGTPIQETWKPLAITAADTDDELALLPDHSLLGTIPLLSTRAVGALKDVLQSCGELLPVIYPRQQYFAYNVTSVIDALDEAESTLRRFTTGRVMSIDNYAFRPDRVRELRIFKIPQLPRAFIFVTDSFADPVRKAGLTGFVFEKVWES